MPARIRHPIEFACLYSDETGQEKDSKFFDSDGIPSLQTDIYCSTVILDCSSILHAIEFCQCRERKLRLVVHFADKNANTKARNVEMRRIKPSLLPPPVADTQTDQKPLPNKTAGNGVITTTGVPMP
ncbi:hypothetical protein RHGRI_000874 [Rhododendron griersonianum]|uniref:Uncharacterized protein n=1 Tax=Rhododendron griersonianum TaxID=479676 RepID=A0AAV6LI78_9ERIC|nr:hypothetical protein RHGRI_000874 [Rhododendron griersonianum]